tara:strand:- start:1282 stop:1587 length:306 start_codon:yes stop_codon:yes gene_type:complete
MRDLKNPLGISTFDEGPGDKKKGKKTKEKEQAEGINKVYPISDKSDSASWARRELPKLTNQGLSKKIDKLRKMSDPKHSNVINSKIRMIKSEQKRRYNKKK